MQGCSSNLLSDYFFPSSSTNRATPSHSSKRQLKGKWLDCRIGPSGPGGSETGLELGEILKLELRAQREDL